MAGEELDDVTRVKLSLLSPERQALPANTPVGFVVDLYMSLLTPEVARERVADMLIEYTRRCLLLDRAQIIPQIRFDFVPMMRPQEHQLVLMRAALYSRLDRIRSWVLDNGTLSDLNRLGALIAGIVSEGIQPDQRREMEDVLWLWWRVCELYEAEPVGLLAEDG